MKKLSALICGLLLATLPSILHAQAALEYKIDKVIPTIVTTPQYSVQGSHPASTPGKWLQVEVQFESFVPFTDEMTFKYYVAISGTDPNNPILLTGEVTHVNVPKGRELYSVMYVSPRILARLIPASMPVTPNIIRVVGVQLLVKGKAVYEKSSSGGGPEWWQNLEQTPGLLVNKNETPFAPLDWDRYEPVKATH